MLPDQLAGLSVEDDLGACNIVGTRLEGFRLDGLSTGHGGIAGIGSHPELVISPDGAILCLALEKRSRRRLPLPYW